MTESLTMTWKDRMRVERAVWTLDSYLRNLPRKSRIAKRRELRVNLRAASADVGASEALRRLGNIRNMAAEYLVTEYGGPGPSWIVATYFLFAAFYFMFWFENARIDAFKAGAIVANPHLTGMFHMSGIAYVFTNGRFIFTNGKVSESAARCCHSSTCASWRWPYWRTLWRAVPALRHRPSLGESNG